jgi:hypothetical protein
MSSLQRNIVGQNITFMLVNATTGAPLTGATVSVFFTVDNLAQATGGGTVTEKGHGQYNYAPQSIETNGTDCGFAFNATNAVPVNIDFHTDPPNFAALQIDANGNVFVTSTFKKGVARAGVMFPMTDATTHQLKPAIVFSAANCVRSSDGNPPVTTTNVPTEVGGGIYAINLSAADLSGNNNIFTFSASGADPTVMEIPTQP